MCSLILNAALRRGLVRSNVVSFVDRPREQRRKWRILSPPEVVRVKRALDALIDAAEGPERDDLLTARTLFLTLIGTGIRLSEALGLRWRSVLLADPEGPVMRVEETWVRSAVDTPKSRAGQRTIALGSRVAAELFEHRRSSPFSGDDERVFANPRTGNPFNATRYAVLVRRALKRAGIEDYVRTAHDLRHSSITNAAAAGTPPEALMTRSGHSSYATTKRYIDLAGRFRPEAERLERRLWGDPVPKAGTNSGATAIEEETERRG